jgi:hypothetical protein
MGTWRETMPVGLDKQQVSAAGQVAIKDRINPITLAPTEDFRRDSDLFGEGVRTAEAQRLIQAAIQQGLQTREAEMELAGMLGAVMRRNYP